MKNIKPETLALIRERYPVGSRVELVTMTDPYQSVLTPGVKGTVVNVDDIGTIHVLWDCGSSLGVVYDEDVCRILNEDSKK